MRVLVTGATGFIGSQLVTELLKAGHEVVCAVRDVRFARSIFANAQVIHCDFRRDSQIAHWLPRLEGVDVVINTVGILYHPLSHVIWQLHYETPKALFLAAEQQGVQKIFHISALGVNTSQCAYAASKKATEDFLASSKVPNIVLRPSYVYGRGSYGGGSLFRGLAAVPGLLALPAGGKQLFQPIHCEDLAKAVVNMVSHSSKGSVVVSAVGSTQHSLADILKSTRKWLGFGKALMLNIPKAFIKMGSWLGNLLPNSALNSNSFSMMQLDNVASPNETFDFQQRAGFVPRGFAEGLLASPATVQDRWHARLYFLRPALQYGLAIMWLMICLGSTYLVLQPEVLKVFQQMGYKAFFQPLLLLPFVSGAFGVMLLLGTKLKSVILLQIVLLVLFTSYATVTAGKLWFDPFASLSKNIPVLLAMLVFLVLQNER